MDQTVDKLTAQIEAERERVLELLDRLRDALAKERFEVRADSAHLTLHPTSRMELDLKARQRDDHESLRLTLRWPKQAAAPLEIRPRATPPAHTAPAHDADDPALWTYAALYQRASEREIPGRSRMNKEELLEALLLDDPSPSS